MLNTFLHSITNWFDRLSMQQWLYVLMVVTAIGAVCMKGFGSRSKY